VKQLVMRVAGWMQRLRPASLQRALLVGITVPLAAFILTDAASLYQRALAAINTAYDRSLLASAKSIGEFMSIEEGKLRVDVPYSALEVFEAGASRLAFRIDGFAGEFVGGDRRLRAYTGTIPQRSAYPALVDFYDDTLAGEPVRVAALYQPVASVGARGVARIQVAETLQTRQALARGLLIETLWRQGVLLLLLVGVTWLAVWLALRPLVRLRSELDARDAHASTAIAVPDAPRELQPVVGALNRLFAHERDATERQRRFVRDASHQLRTPFAVLKTQLQSAQRGDLPAAQALDEMADTVERATRLANQLLALAKVGQAETLTPAARTDLAEAARAVALDVAPLIAAKSLQFEFEAPHEKNAAVSVRGHEWMVREMLRNLLSNAIRHTPPGGALGVRVTGGPPGEARGQRATLAVWDSGPGVSGDLRLRLFEPFATGDPTQGAGLGLAICREIADSLGAALTVESPNPSGGLTITARWQAD
jgi:two-component system, OmpR family, sensor histidine kinase TctE